MSASKFTPRAPQGLARAHRTGVSLADACRAEGLRVNTVKSWLHRGRQEGEGPYADFARAIDEARHAAKAQPGSMGADELARVVSEMARKGSVQAAKLRWEMLRAPNGQEAPDADEFDELKARRARRGG
jgi:hypothetical protein